MDFDHAIATLTMNPSLNGIAKILTPFVTAFIGALLAFRNQNSLAVMRRKEEEQRMAFVNLVRISEIVAIGKGFPTVIEGIKPLLLSENKPLWDLFFPDHSRYTWIHASSALLSHVLRKPDQEDVKALVDTFKRSLDSIKQSLDFVLPPQTLAQLPREAILAYQNFSISVGHTLASIRLVASSLDNPSKDPIPAIVAFSFFDMALKMFSHAEILRLELVDAGACTIAEADSLLDSQIQRRISYSQNIMRAQPSVAEAEQTLLALIPRHNSTAAQTV